MNKFDLQKRTMGLAVEVVKLTKSLPYSQEGKIITNQIIRCASSTAANYRASCRAKSRKDFIAKMGIVEEECDETIFWLEFMNEIRIIDPQISDRIKKEANTILSIVVASIKTASKGL